MKKIIISSLFICFFSFSLFSKSEILKIEPPNWWVGMEQSTIEILVYGRDLGSLRPVIKGEDVSLISYKSYTNPNYIFITIKIDEDAKAGEVLIQLVSSDNKDQLEFKYPIYDREPGRKMIKGFDASDVIYLITPDRFANGEPSNDENAETMEDLNRSDPMGRHGGDLAGVINHLDYIDRLGFTAIWLNPVLENDMPKYSYHGYAITDFYNVDPRYGTNEDYKKLVTLAGERGIKIVNDQIANHCGSEHWWMKDLPSNNWLNDWQKYSRTNHAKTSLQDPYAAKADVDKFIRGWFVETMPDLNQEHPSMANYLIQNSIWWIEYSGIAGIRMDTYPYPDPDFMNDWAAAIMKEYPNFNIVGEEWNYWPQIVSYWQNGKENPNGYKSALPSVMDFPIQDALVKSLNEQNSWKSSWGYVYEMLGQDYLYPEPMNLMIFPDNHDMMRIHSQLNENVDHTKLAMIYILTMRGIPKIYYGTEILMTSTNNHGNIRSDYPGGWEEDKVNAFTGEGLTEEAIEFRNFLSKLMNWRKNTKAIHKGGLVHFYPERNDVYVYFRLYKDHPVMVILNKNKEEIELDLDRFKEYIPAEKAKEIISGKEINIGKKLKIGAKKGLILEF